MVVRLAGGRSDQSDVVFTRYDSRVYSWTKSNVFDSSDRRSDCSDEAFTQCDQRLLTTMTAAAAAVIYTKLSSIFSFRPSTTKMVANQLAGYTDLIDRCDRYGYSLSDWSVRLV